MLMKYCKLSNFAAKFQVNDIMHNNIYRCLDTKNKIYVACKIHNKKQISKSALTIINNEIRILYQIPCSTHPKLEKIYEDDNYIYMIFQYFHGEEFTKILHQFKMKELAIATFAYHILKGLKRLHEHGIYHGNLSLDNLIFCQSSKDKELYMINQRYVEEPDEEFYEATINSGHNLCVAPEVLSKQPIDSQIDMFSLGCCLFYMLFQKFPYKYILSSNQKYFYELDIKILKELKEHYQKNIKGQQILSQSGINFLEKLLKVDPKKRITCKEAIFHHWFVNTAYHPTQPTSKQIQGALNASSCSLRTIMETSEFSESREMISIQSPNLLAKIDEDEDIPDDYDGELADDDYGEVEQKMNMLNMQQIRNCNLKLQKFEFKKEPVARNDSSTSTQFQDQSPVMLPEDTKSRVEIDHNVMKNTYRLKSEVLDNLDEDLKQKSDPTHID